MSHRGKPVTRQIREQRQREAAVRQAEYDALTLQQKLDKLPPPPHAEKQRTRLLAQVAKPRTTPAATVVSESSASEDSNSKPLKAKERRAKEKNS